MKLLKINIRFNIIYYIQTFSWIILKNNNLINKEKEYFFIFALFLYLTIGSLVFNEKIFSFKKVESTIDYFTRLLSMLIFYNNGVREWVESYINIYFVFVLFVIINFIVEYLLYKDRLIYDSYCMDKTKVIKKIKGYEIDQREILKSIILLMALMGISYMLPVWFVVLNIFFQIPIMIIIMMTTISLVSLLLYLQIRKEVVIRLYEKENVKSILRIEMKWIILGYVYTLLCLGWLYFISETKNTIYLWLILPQILCTVPTYNNIRELARFTTEK